METKPIEKENLEDGEEGALGGLSNLKDEEVK